MNEPRAEPWLRGPVAEVDVLLAPLLYSFSQAREDLALHTGGLSPAQMWGDPFGLGSAGFHIRHIAGSTDRLTAYLKSMQLSAEQMATLRAENEPGASREALLAEMHRSFERTEQIVRALDPSTLREARTVGRQRLPTTVIGLLTHIAEHNQRHVGQAISAAKLAKSLKPA